MEKNQEDYSFWDSAIAFAGSYFGAQSAQKLQQAPQEQAALSNGTPQPNSSGTTATPVALNSNTLMLGAVAVAAVLWMTKGGN